MEDIMQHRDFKVGVPSSSIFEALLDHIEGEAYVTMLTELYRETRKFKKKEKEHKRHMRELEKWNTGEKNLFQILTDNDIDEIFDVFFIMIVEYDPEIDHREAATDRLDKRLDLHRNTCEYLAAFMSDTIAVVKKKLIPDDDFVYLDTNKLSDEERKKIERLWTSEIEEKIAINDEAITLTPTNIHIEGNQVLIDPKRMDPRERKTLRSALDPDQGLDSSVALPVRALVQFGESVNEKNIEVIRSFPEENPDRSVEEADETQYAKNDHITEDRENLDSILDSEE